MSEDLLITGLEWSFWAIMGVAGLGLLWALLRRNWVLMLRLTLIAATAVGALMLIHVLYRASGAL